MDFDENLTKLQGALMSLGNRGLLNTSDHKKGVEILRDIFQRCSNLQKSKLTFLMVLNTKLTVVEKLKNDKNVGLLIDITPQLTKNQLISYIYELNLQSCLNEIIEHCPSELSLELMDVAIRKLKDASFHKDKAGVEHVYAFWRSVFIKIYKCEKGIHDDGGTRRMIHFFEEIYNLIKKILITSLKVKNLKVVEYIGNHFYHLFNVILFMLNLYLFGKPKFESMKIYELTTDLKTKVREDSENQQKPTEKCMNLIFLKISSVLEFLTIDIWMALSDCYLSTNSTDSIQRLAGECIYEICELLRGKGMFPEIVACLTHCQVQPRSETNKMADAGITEIIENIEKGKYNWFKALIQHPLCLEDVKSIKCISEHMFMATEEDVTFILESCLEHITFHLKKQQENLNSVKELFFKGFKMVPEKDCAMWLRKIFKNYKPNFLETKKFNEELVETFNKIGHRKVTVRDLVCLFVQSPKETLKKLCELAICDKYQVDCCLDVTKIVKVGYESMLACYPVDKANLLDVVLLDCLLPSELTVKERKGFLLWVARLEEENLIGETFFKSLLETMREQLKKEYLEKVVCCLEILKLFPEVVGTYAFSKPILLVFLSRVLEHLSWDMTNFLPVKLEGRDLVISIVTTMINGLKDEDASKLEWVRREVIKISVVNQACFCDLWFRFELDWSGSKKLQDAFLILANTQTKALHLQEYLTNLYISEGSDVKTSIILALAMILPVLTFREWSSIFENLTKVVTKVHEDKNDFDVDEDIFNMFSSSMYLLSLKLNVFKNIYPCFERCVRHFGRLINKWLSQTNTRSSVEVLENTLFFLKAIRDNRARKACTDILSTVLLSLAEKVNAIEEGELKSFDGVKVRRLLNLIDVKPVAEAMMKKLPKVAE